MPAIIIMFLIPIAMIFVSKSCRRDIQMSRGEAFLRYIVYFGMLFFLSSVVMGVMKDDDTSFFQKISQSTAFAVKFIVLQLIMAVGITVAEWLLLNKRITDKGNWDKFYHAKEIVFLRKYIFPYLVYVLAAFVICCNISLMFDNVVWGDEAFSANTAKKDVDGILQVLYYWDNHPPLHYYWTKLFGELFGHTVPVYHLASLVPFIGGILLAVTQLRKRFGSIPASFFIIISGLGVSCLEYNLEIRMYSLAFCGVLAAFYCAYRVISTGTKSAWISMVLWALVAAYSHYYALVAVGIMLFLTGVAFWIKHRGKTWRKGLGAIIGFIAGYAPWLYFLFTALKNVSGNWWMTDILGFDVSLRMVTGSYGLSIFILPLFLLTVVVLVLAESSLFRVETKNSHITIQMHKPSTKGWSDETYSVLIGTFTLIGTMTFAYLLCYLMSPMLAERYLYPVSAVTFMVLVIGFSRLLTLLKKWGELVRIPWAEMAGKLILLLFLCLFLGIGLHNYEAYSTEVWDQNEKTNATLNVIGEPAADVQMVTNGVKHLGWTVLYHYYPDNEVINGDFDCAESDEFWYFNPSPIDDAGLQYLKGKGLNVISYGEMQLSQYPFYLYHMEK